MAIPADTNTICVRTKDGAVIECYKVQSKEAGTLRGYIATQTLAQFVAQTDEGAYKILSLVPANGPATTTPLAVQVGGDHYKKLAIQPIEYIHANKLGFCEGSVIKYVTRWRDKNGIADLEKAKHFIELLIELEKKEESMKPK